ncbi:MAG: hypothetical protein GC151_14115 [Betaproteobacteria bacterium]|nr:hypothetical protein [Betaproteobacteria bacterium]
MDIRAIGEDAQWLLRREGARLKWRGLAGLALFAAVAGLAVTLVWPVRSDVANLKAEVAGLRARLKAQTRAGGESRAAPTRADQLDTFYAFFPATRSLPDWVGQIHNAAQRNGLSLDRGDYRLQQHAGEKLLRYEVRLPVKGSYPQLRGFIAEVLHKVPAASLENVTLKRDDIHAPDLDARLTFVIFLGDGT